MKKIYQNPTTKVMRIELHQMIAASPTTEQRGFGDDVDDASGADARRFGSSLWDDED